jgi:hypothetical protein
MSAGTATCPVSAAAITARKRENRIRHNTPDRRASHTPERHHANITMSRTSFTLCSKKCHVSACIRTQLASSATPRLTGLFRALATCLGHW